MSVKNYPNGTHIAGPLKMGASSMLTSSDVGGIGTSAKTLTADESNGQHYILDSGTGVAITLPVPTKGWQCKFTVGAAFSTDFTFIAGTADTLEGCLIEAGAVQDVNAADQIVLEDGTENVGDFLNFWSDGTSIFVFGNTLTAASSTPSG